MASKYAAASRDFAARFRDAIMRRAHPNGRLHLKQIADVTGYSRDSFMRWWRGEARMPADAVDALVTFFEGAGDSAFLHEIFGREAAALSAEIDAMKRRLVELEHRANAPLAHTVGTANGAAPQQASRVVGALRQPVDAPVAPRAVEMAPR